MPDEFDTLAQQLGDYCCEVGSCLVQDEIEHIAALLRARVGPQGGKMFFTELFVCGLGIGFILTDLMSGKWSVANSFVVVACVAFALGGLTRRALDKSQRRL